MSSTTTTPPSTRVQIHQAAVLALRVRALLTIASRPELSSLIRAAEAREDDALPPERPAKRLRLGPGAEASSLTRCLESQVFPYVDSAIAALPKDRVNTLEIGKRIIAILTGPEFTTEYKRGNGRLSAEYEAKLALRASMEARSLSTQTFYQLPPLNPVSSAPLPSPIGPRVAYRPASSLADSTTPTPPRYSSSPIPLPTIPRQSPSKVLGVQNGVTDSQRRNSLAPTSPSKAEKTIIIIDDDDEDKVPLERPVAVEEPVITKPTKPPAVALEKPAAAPIQKPTATTLQKPAAVPLEKPVAAPLEKPTATPLEKPAAAPLQKPTATPLVKHAASPLQKPAAAISEKSTLNPRAQQPYITAAERAQILSGARRPVLLGASSLLSPATFHADFTLDEVRYLRALTRKTLGLSTDKVVKDPLRDLEKMLKRNQSHISRILDAVAHERRLPSRRRTDLDKFFRDVIGRKTRPDPALLRIQRDNRDRRVDLAKTSRVQALLHAREIHGQRGFGAMRRLVHFNNEFRKSREESLELRAEWTGCAGDIATITWVSNDGFICGTTEHSDSHNQQYNKPGNLVLGSCSLGTLRAYPDHRIVRPIVTKGENSTEAMRQSQDPWLYSSVVSSDYDAVHARAFTSGFDRSVKIWQVEPSGASMSLLGEWKHGGNVNFVAASKHASGLVATAADVAVDAVRIYSINEDNISKSSFRSYSCSRVTDAEGNTVSTEKWAYYPATMQWGLSEDVKHLLLVGYSPRSRTDDDNDIPEDRRDTGELCLWDGLTGERWRITSATTQNVFEVLWHPSQPSFIAATSPLGLDLEPSVRTQIRIFRPADKAEYGSKAFSPFKVLDCMALDINELSIMPNSYTYCYITAGCTDGCTYVWDTAISDKPLHVLRHGKPIDEYRVDREREDVGVKFTAWGTTPDRFYTGSSDGIVKVWNVRTHGNPLVRNLLEAPAPITSGMFSPDRSRLVVGDASGRVFMLSLEEEEQKPASFVQLRLQGSRDLKRVRRPTPIIRHPEPAPPSHDADGKPIEVETGSARGHSYLERSELERHPNPTIGVVQGPQYADTGLFRREAHLYGDPSQPLLATWEVKQQEAQKGFSGRRRDRFAVLRPIENWESAEALHSSNLGVDQAIWVPEEIKQSLSGNGVDFDLMADYILDYEEMPVEYDNLPA